MLERRKPLGRRTELARGEPPKRKTRLRWRSAKAIELAPLRAEVVAAVLHRDSYRCQLRGYAGDCYGPLDVHEVVRRSQHPGAHLDETLCITLCRRHHELDEDRVLAETIGIRVPGWRWERDGMRAVRDAAALRRAAAVAAEPS